MSISPVSSYNDSALLDLKLNRSSSGEATTTTTATAQAETDRVQISVEARQYETYRTLPEKGLAAVETKVAAPDPHPDPLQAALDKSYKELFERAGRSDYLASIANPTDLSPEATAKRILGGVTGYIFGGYQLAHPNLSKDDLDQFKSLVLRGFDEGLGQAKDQIKSQDKMDDTLAGNIQKTVDLFQKGFEDFYQAWLKKLNGDNQTPEKSQTVADVAAAPSQSAPTVAVRASGDNRQS